MAWQASRARAPLLASFGGMILLLAATGAGALATLDGLERQHALGRQQLLESSRALERVRSGVLLSGIFARDYFAAPNAAGAPQLAGRLGAIRLDTMQALETSARLIRPQLASLRGEIEAYWKVLDLMAEMARRGQSAGTDAFFRTQLHERRETMSQIAAAIGAAGEAEWSERARTFERQRARTRSIAIALLALSLTGGSLLALFTIRRLLNLEAQSAGFASRLMKAQEEERRAIARELHDGVGQSLSALLIDAGPAARRAGEQALESVRRLALSLRPSMLDDLGLVPALEWQARETTRQMGIAVDVKAEGDFSALSEQARTCVYRVAQEAITNACRHSGAHTIQLNVRCADSRVTLCVADDGRGFDPSRQRGLGLLGIEERARRLGATLRFDSQPGRGAKVLLDLPEHAA